jgi:hypothetical protein
MNGYQGSQAYEVSEILHFRAINPKRSNTDFIDLDSNEHYSANDVFQRVYTAVITLSFKPASRETQTQIGEGCSCWPNRLYRNPKVNPPKLFPL